jgi:hypothetical protein
MFALLLKLAVPAWVIAFLVCATGFLFCCWKIGPSRPATHYLPDIMTPILKLICLLVWIILFLIAVLIIGGLS